MKSVKERINERSESNIEAVNKLVKELGLTAGREWDIICKAIVNAKLDGESAGWDAGWDACKKNQKG